MKKNGAFVAKLLVNGTAVAFALAVGVSTDGLTPRSALAQWLPPLHARVVAKGIPGASALAEVGPFLNDLTACARPVPTLFLAYTQPGAILDPVRVLVGSRSNFGAPLAAGVGQEGSLISIDPAGTSALKVPRYFAQGGGQASALGGRVQMFSANSPDFLNKINNPGSVTANYAGVSNPLGLSNNNAFGRVWPANSPFGDRGIGSSSILDPTGLPLNGAPQPLIGGVYVGALTGRDQVFGQPQVLPGSLAAGAVGTALLGPSPDGTCKAVFAVVTADGAIVQEHTVKGLDGLAPAGTIHARRWRGGEHEQAEPRLGVLMNPYVDALPANVVLQLFVSEPFENTIAVVDLTVVGPAGSEVFTASSVRRIISRAFNHPVDLAPVKVDADDKNWASNTTLDDGSDIYVANQGDSTIVRIKQDGSVVAVRRVFASRDGEGLENARLNGVAASRDGATIYATYVGDDGEGGVLAMPAF